MDDNRMDHNQLCCMLSAADYRCTDSMYSKLLVGGTMIRGPDKT